MEEKQVCTGTVVWFNERRGYGFLKPDGGDKDYFVHYTNIVSEMKFKTLVAGQRVTFTVGANKNGPQAENIAILDE